MSTRMILFLSVLLLIDSYVFFGLKNSLAKSTFQVVFLLFYTMAALSSYVGIYALSTAFVDRPVVSTVSQNLLIGFGFSFVIFKLLITAFLLLDDVIRIFVYLYNVLIKLFVPSTEISFEGRRKFLVNVGLGIASIPFASMLYGITKGKYNYKVKELTLKFPKLPKSFEGFKIVQISDIHSGSFDSLEDVRRGVQMINEQGADVVFFTGDLVNNEAQEVAPFIGVFKEIKAKHGTFSILGNHDYGDYKSWPSQQAKVQNLELLEKYQADMNFQLLKNENTVLKRGADEISIIGVENWGKPPFVTHGDLDKALQGVTNDTFKILLSHDPSHWDEKVIPHNTKIDLTLSGHTHGMQFGVDIPGFKWSPVKYKYPRWSGLYEQAEEYLYVNRGFGFLGFPGRVGMWPEITVINLTT